ncbi:MAG TPA: CDP-alcohol phosphatidyltransferase family protein [Ktedonobacteraceae bacterium]|nr:CDP-alcohol phosphatidyltransferase family protein [Ktedonobacteraceae bacterium]
MFSRRIQQRARQFVTMIIRPFARLGVTPNMLTFVGLLLSIVTASVVAQGNLFAGGLLVLFSGVFDMFDGAMARARGTSSTFGAFYDSTLDRYSEGIILGGLLIYTMRQPGLNGAPWPFASEQTWMVLLIYTAMLGSLMVSYTKARAEGLGLECKKGLLARPERVVLLAIGLLISTVVWWSLVLALALLAVFSHVTAVERIVHVWKVTNRVVEVSKAKNFSSQGFTHDQNNGVHIHQSSTAVGTTEAVDAPNRSISTGVPPLPGGVHPE